MSYRNGDDPNAEQDLFGIHDADTGKPLAEPARPPLWHQARKLASTAFNLLPMPVQLQNFTREERERYVDAMGDVIYSELENAKLHGIRLAALEVHKLPPQEHDEKGRRDWHWEVKRKVWLACREAVPALLP